MDTWKIRRAWKKFVSPSHSGGKWQPAAAIGRGSHRVPADRHGRVGSQRLQGTGSDESDGRYSTKRQPHPLNLLQLVGTEESYAGKAR